MLFFVLISKTCCDVEWVFLGFISLMVNSIGGCNVVEGVIFNVPAYFPANPSKITKNACGLLHGV